MQFNCVFCECTLPSTSGVRLSEKLMYSYFNSQPLQIPLETALMSWYTTLERYVTCALTNWNDYFSGLAREYKKKTPELGEYLAGIWSADMLNGLL
jgi:hypothetical protein